MAKQVPKARTKNIYKARKGTLKVSAERLGTDIGFRFRGLEKNLDNLFTSLGENPVVFLDLFQNLMGKLFENIILATPVDTGQARASWRIQLTTEGESDIVWRITNGVPYIVFLELGSSKQAPKGMVRINLDKFIRDTRSLSRRLAASGRFTR